MSKITNWSQIQPGKWKHDKKNIKIDIGETHGGFYRIDKVTPNSRKPIGSEETKKEAMGKARHWMKNHPDG